MMRKDFWKNIPIEKLTREEWEALCDGCGKCCLIKLQKDKLLAPIYTSVACEFLNLKSCRCTVYSSRVKKKKDCLVLTPDNLQQMVEWLPNSCSYRLVHEKKDLPDWHYLNKKNQKSVHISGNSVQNLAISEIFVAEEDLEDFIVKY